MSEYRYAFEEPGRFARGWHIIMFSQELAVGEVKAIHYFDQELVIYRGENGEAAILDAYCPHLGAHLAGTGAAVVENTLRCPFHGWRFDSDGACVDIPYANNIPEKAKSALKGWPVVEKSGFIAVWHCAEGSDPDWELPEVPEWGPEQLGDWRFNRRRIKTQGREIVENIVDSGHFGSVHGGRVEKWDIEFKEHTVTQRSIVQPDPEATMIIPGGVEIDIEAIRDNPESRGRHEGWASYQGPAVMYFYTHQTNDVYDYEGYWINYYTPINAEEVELTSGVLIKPDAHRPPPPEIVDFYHEIAYAAFSQDIEVWETKIYRPDPILCDGDGPITKLRKWYDQFYQVRA